MPLSAPEKRNAFGGPLPLLIRKIAKHPFFTDSVKDGIKNDRYQHLDLAAKILYLTKYVGFQSTKKATLDNFVDVWREERRKGKALASEQTLKDLEERAKEVLERMGKFFRKDDPLLRSVGRITLYFHIFRIHLLLNKDLVFGKDVLERFNADVARARAKRQRMASGSGEKFDQDEQLLSNFDIEKQSPNDGGALERQYRYMREYFLSKFKVALPERYPGLQ